MRLILLIISLLFSFSYNNTRQTIINTNTTSLLKLDEYKEIQKENIVKIEKVFYGEGGDSKPVIYDDKEEIESMYNYFENIRVSGPTEIACEDNTTVYHLYLKDGTTKTITFECEVLIVGNKRLLVVN